MNHPVFMCVTDLLCAAEVERELVPVLIRENLHIPKRVRDNELLMTLSLPQN
jgi:hypothetical protein